MHKTNEFIHGKIALRRCPSSALSHIQHSKSTLIVKMHSRMHASRLSNYHYEFISWIVTNKVENLRQQAHVVLILCRSHCLLISFLFSSVFILFVCLFIAVFALDAGIALYTHWFVDIFRYLTLVDYFAFPIPLPRWTPTAGMYIKRRQNGT